MIVNGACVMETNGYSIGGGEYVEHSLDVLVDTVTELMYLPPQIIERYYSKVSGAFRDTIGDYIFPRNASLPDIALRLRDYDAVVPGAYINHMPNNDPLESESFLGHDHDCRLMGCCSLCWWHTKAGAR